MTQWNWNRIGLFDINFDTGEAYWSRELRRILDVPDDMPADFELLLTRIHPDDRRQFATFAAETFQCGCPPYRTIEPRMLRTNGEVQRVHADIATVFRGIVGIDAVRLVGLVVEITTVKPAAGLTELRRSFSPASFANDASAAALQPAF